MTTDLVKQLRTLSAENPSPRDCIDYAADELERLYAENSNLKREAWTWSKACETATKQLEPNRVDAARYRWLRGRDLDTISKGGVFAGLTPNNFVLNGEDLDREIDSASLKE
jgi:hypothetical protein